MHTPHSCFYALLDIIQKAQGRRHLSLTHGGEEDTDITRGEFWHLEVGKYGLQFVFASSLSLED